MLREGLSREEITVGEAAEAQIRVISLLHKFSVIVPEKICLDTRFILLFGTCLQV